MLTLLQILIVYAIVASAKQEPKSNVCKTLEGYLDIDKSPDCYYEEDITLMTPELIRKYSGTLETYNMITEDGYKITMFRIPRKSPKGVVLLYHPLNTNSNVFMFSGNNSLAMTLWHSGFDVWLSNHRGSNFSLLHTHLSALQYQYWNFTFHEIATFDLVEQVKVIREHTNNSRIIFYGYSMGADVGLVYASMFPAIAKEYFKVFILAGVPCYFEYAKGVTVVSGQLSDQIRTLVDYLKLGTTIPIVPTMRYLVKYILRYFPSYHFLHTEFLHFVFGHTQGQNEPANFPVDLIHFIDYFSSKLMVHIFQLIKAKNRFQWYDYGRVKNMKHYGTETPPLYALQNIVAPLYLISGAEDIMTTPKDTNNLLETISPEARIYGHWKVDNFNHIEFLSGRLVKEYHDELIKFLNKICM